MIKTVIVGAATGAAALAMATAPAKAQTRPGFEIGAELVDYSYREHMGSSTLVRDDGLIGRVRASYVETIGGGAFLRAIYDVGAGKIDYRGDDGTRIDGVEQTLGQLELHVGKDLRFGAASVTAFTGVGGRALFDGSGGRAATSGAFGYDRTIRYAFVPVGLSVTIGKGRARLIVSAQFNQLLGGRAESQLSDVDKELPDLKLRLRGGHGLQFSGMVAIAAGKHEVRLGPVLRRWRLERSRDRTFADPDGTITFFEPANQTTELSLRLSVAF